VSAAAAAAGGGGANETALAETEGWRE